MPEYYRSYSRKPWLDDDIRRLKELARCDTPTGAMALKLRRSKAGVYAKASELGISLGVASQTKQRVEAGLTDIGKSSSSSHHGVWCSPSLTIGNGLVSWDFASPLRIMSLASTSEACFSNLFPILQETLCRALAMHA